MAITLDATVGGANANSYCTVADADDYHSTLTQDLSDVWANADKAKMLMWATRLVDQHWKFIGQRVSSDQALEFPRKNVYRDGVYFAGDYPVEYLSSSTIPAFLKNAVAEMARILSEENVTAVSDKVGVEKIKVGSIELDMTGSVDITEGVFRPAVYDMLAKYGQYLPSLKDERGIQVVKLVRG
jgi:hypothetical protein